MYIIEGKRYNVLGKVADDYGVSLNCLVMVVFRTKVPKLIDCVNIVRKVSNRTLRTYDIKKVLEEACNIGILDGNADDYLTPNLENYEERYEPLDRYDQLKLSRYGLDDYIGYITSSDIDELIEVNGKAVTITYKGLEFTSIYEFCLHFGLKYPKFYERYKKISRLYPHLTTEEVILNHMTVTYKDIKVINKLELRNTYGIKKQLGREEILTSEQFKEVIETTLHYYDGKLHESVDTLMRVFLQGKIKNTTKGYLKREMPFGDCTEFITDYLNGVRVGV